jgi:hypothetical protein
MAGRKLGLSLGLTLVAFAVARGDSRNQEFSDFTMPLPLKPGETLVLGIVGGWERWDQPLRIVRRIALAVRDQSREGVFVETVENHKIELGEELVRRAFDWNGTGVLEPHECAGVRLVVYGQSLGGRETVRFCRRMNELGIPVLLAVTVDAVGREDYTIPPNVRAAANLYQKEFLPIHGADAIRAADPSRTRILGNWEYRYGNKQVDTSGEPWVRRTFMGAHLKLEYDPEVWEKVKGLILDALNAR